MRRAGCALISTLVLFAVAAPTTMAGPTGEAVAVTSLAGGAKRIKYKIGPFDIVPGQNEIGYAPITEKPQVDGYFTRIRPDLTYLDGSVPGVEVIHLHHGVWVNMSRRAATLRNFPVQPFFAAGEEKTVLRLPKGYGYPIKATDGLLLNHMIHNLTPVPTKVYMVYEVDFVPAGSRAARGMRAVRPIWMDVQNGNLYPVFNVEKGSGTNGRYTYPNQASNPYGGGPKKNEWVVDKPGVLVATAGHLHPGGLYTDLKVRRRGATIKSSRKRNAPRGRGNTAHLFRSVAKYYEPAGAVSWDVAMTGTRLDWRVKLRKGDVLSTSATYDTKRGSWWESMGIMVAYMADGGPGVESVQEARELQGHGHARPSAGEQQSRRRPDRPARPAPAGRRRGEPRVGEPGQLQVSVRRPQSRRARGTAAGDSPRPDPHVPRRRGQREADLPLDHVVQAAL